ncbi:nitrophenyl compound nitroreductase subunit ArsF family protein [uncultured Methanospirillum sp.]|uniref:nitrophenyl compound nitroreductase subunit ArsF family protein n=1 Tax=uncultured Methanospirillum sp. TaxID=262503 RepID=UPI0029C861E2|nr:nitrophenyl compound nitroreductase subunit ArsF family protein [uncultured Methanospirillum sp.]
MNDKKRYNGMALPLLILAITTVLLILSGGCGCNKSCILGNQSFPEPGQSAPVFVSSDAIEVYHFHPAQQCYSCQVLGQLAEETVNSSFARELADGRLIFAHINAELPENAELVSRYGVTSSSLMIGYTNETGFHAENQIGLWYTLGDKEGFMNDLRSAVYERLGRNQR